MSALNTHRATDGPPADPMTDHEYDGIREYDNPTPGWWSLIFFVSFIWALGYWIIYELDYEAPRPVQVWEREVAEANKILFAKLGDLKPDADTMLALAHEENWMLVGQSIFLANCASCHARDARGDVGPNMTDDSYKNIKVITDIPRVIREGANNLAMPAQRGRLSENEIILVSAYIASLRGKNLPGRPPEGDKIPPWPAPTSNPLPKSPATAPKK